MRKLGGIPTAVARALLGLWNGKGCDSSFAPAGYFQFPPDTAGRRLMIQWALFTNNSGQDTWTFPKAFPNVCWVVVGNTANASSGADQAAFTVLPSPSKTPSGIAVFARNQTTSGTMAGSQHFLVAIGY